MRKVGFLYLRSIAQVHHSISIANALSHVDGVEVVALVSCALNRDVVAGLVERGGGRVAVEMLAPGFLHDALRLWRKRLHPKIGVVLRRHRDRLLRFDALVSTNRFLGPKEGGRPLQVFTGHGAVEPVFGYPDELHRFDLILAPGQSRRDTLLRDGMATADKVEVIGYPKFDLVRPGDVAALFPQRRPVVVYNPHFRAGASSWFRWGVPVLDHFLHQDEFNLVFAPHMNLFSKRRDPVARKYLEAPHVHVDVDSTALIDMTYTGGADLYLGDISSQAYEFVAYKPRPCLFLDAFGIDWKARAEYKMWEMGPVLTDVAALGPALREAIASFDRYAPAQQAQVRDSFAQSEVPAGERGARAIVALLDSRG